MKSEVLLVVVALVLGTMGLFGCDSAENPLAPYEGSRPFVLQAVTQSFAPDVQWVGGRAAAVGVNRGSKAALDSTLVWLTTAGDNTLSAPMRIGDENDEDAVRGFGGTPVDSLTSGQEYTFWIADESALTAGLSGVEADSFSFRDTTFTLDYALRGRSGGDPSLDVTFQIIRNQTLTSDQYTITWTPSNIPFRQLALRKGTLGGFTDLAWHVVVPDSLPDSILPPVVLGQAPLRTIEAIPWEASFEPTSYTLWGTVNGWQQSFNPSATGYAYFQIFSTNFK